MPVSTSDATILVRGFLQAGEYQFQLVAVDQAGNRSQATIISIVVSPPLTFWVKRLANLSRLLCNFTIPLKK